MLYWIADEIQHGTESDSKRFANNILLPISNSRARQLEKRRGSRFGDPMMNTKGKQLAIWGIILQFGFLIGVIGTIIGMWYAFSELYQSGQTNPETLAWYISYALYAEAAGLLISLVGAVLLLIALFGVKYRAPWFRTAMWIMSILWLLSIPVGTILGTVVLIYLSKHKDEFTEPATQPYGGYAGASPPPVS